MVAEVAPQATEQPTIKPKRRRGVTPEDEQAICRLMAEKKMFPDEACSKIGVNYRTWRRHLLREKNNVRVDLLITRLRAERLNILIDRIDAASDGSDGAKRGPDWRASIKLAEIIDRERYGDQRIIGNQTIVNNTVNNNLFMEAAKRIYGDTAKAIDVKQVKEIGDKQVNPS